MSDRKAKDFSITQLSEVTPQEVDWLWENRIARGKVTVLDGDPGTGKSTMLADLAARISTGSPMPDGTPSEQGQVLILNAEDAAADSAVPRLMAAGADIRRTLYLEEGSGLPSLGDDSDWILARLQELKASLLIIDTLPAFLGSGVDTKSTVSSAQSMFQLRRIAEESRAAVVAVRNLRKSSRSENALYAGTDSIAIMGNARTGMLAAADPFIRGQYVLATTKSNLAGKEDTCSLSYRIVSAEVSMASTSKIEWLGDSQLDADDLFADRSREEPKRIDETASWLGRNLTSEPVPACDIVDQALEAGFSKRTLDRAKKKIGAKSVRLNGKRWGWCLGDESA